MARAGAGPVEGGGTGRQTRDVWHEGGRPRMNQRFFLFLLVSVLRGYASHMIIPTKKKIAWKVKKRAP